MESVSGSWVDKSNDLNCLFFPLFGGPSHQLVGECLFYYVFFL